MKRKKGNDISIIILVVIFIASKTRIPTLSPIFKTFFIGRIRNRLQVVSKCFLYSGNMIGVNRKKLQGTNPGEYGTCKTITTLRELVRSRCEKELIVSSNFWLPTSSVFYQTLLLLLSYQLAQRKTFGLDHTKTFKENALNIFDFGSTLLWFLGMNFWV